MTGRPIVIAHRGASGHRPEHTRAAYELAYELGADAVEPDLVVSRDGVLVIRHENEISGTTDVASRPEFARRRARKLVDGEEVTGWFTEDFTWAELSTLRARERRPDVRPASAAYDGRFGLLRFRDLLDLIDRLSDLSGRERGLVAEIKHPTYFAERGFDVAELYRSDLVDAGWSNDRAAFATECFEPGVLARLRSDGVGGALISLMELDGAPHDRVASSGSGARPYAADLTADGMAGLVGRVDGISVPKAMLLEPGSDRGLVEQAHALGLSVYSWTLRPENRYLEPRFRSTGPDVAFGDWEGEFQAVMATGLDGVFADHPDLAVAVREASVGA